MQPLRLIVARQEADRADAERLRLQVYCEEEHLLPASSKLEVADGDRRELADMSLRLLVYAGREPVGTVRLNVASRCCRSAAGFGLELESKFALSGFDQPDLVLAEVTGYCVLRRFRGTRVTPALFAALKDESENRGVTHWVAAANMETDCAEDAAIAYQLIRERSLVSTVFGAHARSTESLPLRATRFVYSRDQRLAARRGKLGALPLPRTLALFANKMGARYLGPPAYDRHFNVFAAPLAVTVASVGIHPATSRALSSLRAEPEPRVTS